MKIKIEPDTPVAEALHQSGVPPKNCTSYEIEIVPDQVVQAHMSVILTRDQFDKVSSVLHQHGISITAEVANTDGVGESFAFVMPEELWQAVNPSQQPSKL